MHTEAPKSSQKRKKEAKRKENSKEREHINTSAAASTLIQAANPAMLQLTTQLNSIALGIGQVEDTLKSRARTQSECARGIQTESSAATERPVTV